MGQKIHPTGFRLAVNKNWSSSGSRIRRTSGNAEAGYRSSRIPEKRLGHASVGRVTIERPAKSARITIHSARPGVVIGKKGEDIELLKQELQSAWAFLCM